MFQALILYKNDIQSVTKQNEYDDIYVILR